MSDANSLSECSLQSDRDFLLPLRGVPSLGNKSYVLQNLEREQCELDRELKSHGYRVDSSSAGDPSRGSRRVSRQSSVSGYFRATLGGNRDLLPEVVEFAEFISATGNSGGWHPDDHSEFLRLLQAAKGDYNVCEATAAPLLFHIKPSQIAAHAKWHQRYLELLERRRRAIKDWRSQKEAARKQDHEKGLPKGRTPIELEEQRQQREERRGKVQAWKASRQHQLQAKAAVMAAEEEAQAAAKAAAWEAQQTAKRREAKAYKARKLQEQREEQQRESERQAVSRRLTVPSAAQIQAAQHRTEEHLRRQADRLAARQAQKEAERLRLEALKRQAAAMVDASAESDPGRLLALTVSRAQKAAAEEPGPIRLGGASIRTVQRKASPAWAKCVR